MDHSRLASLLAAAALSTSGACASVAPRYTPVPDNVNRLLDANLRPVRVGAFTADPRVGEAVNELSIRGGAYQSPYEGSYVNYLREALRQDLQEARLLDPKAAIEVGGVLVRNELDTGMDKGSATIEARFRVTRDGQVRFDKVRSASYEWESSFVGAIAIPRAQQNYPIVVQRLLTGLYADPDFAAALQK